MDNNNASAQPRKTELKALLLCNLRGNNSDIDTYRKIYCGSDQQSDKRFFSLGNTSAFSIYDISAVEGGSGSSSALGKVYEDKRAIKEDLSGPVSYHPIYLSRNISAETTNATSATSSGDYPFCIVTFAYGITHHSKKKQDDSDTSDPPYNISDWLYEGSAPECKKDGQEKSRYERVISDAINGCVEEHGLLGNCRFEVYNALNITDAVILIYTDCIQTGLNIAWMISSQVAQKTYTMVGFPVVASEGDSFPADQVEQLLCDDKNTYHLQIRGSIKKHYNINSINDVLKGIDQNINIAYPLGRDDFRAEISVTGANLLKYIQTLFESNTQSLIADTFWEIHTEFVERKFEPLSCILPKNTRPSIIDNLCKAGTATINDILIALSDSQLFVPAWLLAYKELLSIYQNIGQSPVLDGSAYMVFSFIDTMNGYLEVFKDNEGSILQVNSEGIYEALRNWISLTEQMTRADDLLFTGFGYTPAITNTLPQSLLEFYHAELRWFINQILGKDIQYFQRKHEDRYKEIHGDSSKAAAGYIESVNEKPIYDFLLVPALNQRFQISPVFLEENKGECSKKCSQCRKDLCLRYRHLPPRQIYLVNFSSESLYRPMEFFPMLVHEAFHIFGDKFRQREERKNHIVNTICIDFAQSLKLPDIKELEPVEMKLSEVCRVYLTEGSELSHEMHLRDSIGVIPRRMEKLLCSDRVVISNIKTDPNLAESVKAYPELFLRGGLLQNNWQELAQDNWEDRVEDFEYLFKECFADVMTVTTLGLFPKEYLELFRHEFSVQELPQSLAPVIYQRIALVFAACWNDCAKVNAAINRLYTPPIKRDHKDIQYLRDRYNSLLTDDYYESVSENYEPNTFAPEVMKEILKYLKQAKEQYNTEDGEWRNEVTNHFEAFFRHGRFFTSQYYKIIHDRHKEIRTTCADKS